MSYTIAILGSGNGSNAQNIIDFFKGNSAIRVKLVLSNKADAFILERAEKEAIEASVITKEMLYNTNEVISMLQEKRIDYIILAGFLWLIPATLIAAFPQRIINIHPALLPEFGGKGMYGMHVHEAVIKAGRKQSGITIHLIDEHYDRGKILHQATCEIIKSDTPEILAEKIHTLEFLHFPTVVEKFILSSDKN